MTQDKLKNPYQGAQFMLSVNHLRQLPPDEGAEVAFAGRSNAGKSSALNVITGQRQLARTSKTPGRTQMINYFAIDPGRRLADLPGYGFAKVPVEVKRHWTQILERYLQSRQSLRGLVLMMDIRHPLKEFDRMMLDWCHTANMPVHILLTKADKLKRGPAGNALQQVRKALAKEYPQASIQLFSALNRSGVEEARAVLGDWFGFVETAK